MADYSMVRKLTTIVAIDAVSFSTLAARNEEQALRLLRQRLGTVESFVKQHEGRVFKLTGDGLLAEFASPVEAVRAAVEIQEAMRTANSLADETERLQLRIGVNLGDIVENGPDLLGDGVNVAVRLESLAQSGGICVSSSIYDQILGKLTLGAEDLGEQHVKNIPRPIRAYRLMPGGSSIPIVKPAAAKADRRSWSPLALAGAAVVLVGLGAGGALMATRGLDRSAPAPVQSAAAPPPAATPAAPSKSAAPTSPQGAAAPAQGVSRRTLVPAEVPFFSEARQRDLSNYLNAEGSKALAINVRGYSGYVTRRTDEPTARRLALEACDREVKERAVTTIQWFDKCEVYAVGNQVVWTYKQPPLPLPPFLSESRPKPSIAIDPATVPLIGEYSRKVLAQQYASGSRQKAFALGHGKVDWAVWGASSEIEAARRALQSCAYVSGRQCFIYAINDEVVVRAPDEHRIIEIFTPADLPDTTDAQRDALGKYFVAADWRAIAVGTNGRLGIAYQEASEREAAASALRDCVRANGTDCSIRAVGPYLVTRK